MMSAVEQRVKQGLRYALDTFSAGTSRRHAQSTLRETRTGVG